MIASGNARDHVRALFTMANALNDPQLAGRANVVSVAAPDWGVFRRQKRTVLATSGQFELTDGTAVRKLMMVRINRVTASTARQAIMRARNEGENVCGRISNEQAENERVVGVCENFNQVNSLVCQRTRTRPSHFT
ncbi:hypothetical protein Fuma_03072 [Fuerstiella marisgermanici]|uniref:Uncharacterized protein n=1 Tax=Fuerstiella marisgermanici TaxID=1891926 RepID=A0A1P8WHA8_9PLAN|nr:hypothetical protein Fuma_03072 [Fuerstiella marisgermanici]